MANVRSLRQILFVVAFGAAVGFGSGRAAAADSGYDDGQALLGAKKFREAANKFEAVVAANPGFAQAWYSLAVARRHLNECTGAIAAYRRYSILEPDKSEPYFGLGLCLRDTGDKPGAIEALRHYVAIEKQPASKVWVEKAREILSELGAGSQPAAAPAESKAAVAKTPAAATPSSPLAEAQSLRDRGHVDEAIAKFQEAIAADPKHLPARTALGELLLKVHRDDEAIEVFRAALDKNPASPVALYDLAFALRVRDRPAEAADAYQRYIKLRPSDADAYYGLGRALQRLGRKADARKAYQSYVSMEKRPSERRWVESAQAQLKTLATP
jgi:tetratricopeptide (TPR) repeat protein